LNHSRNVAEFSKLKVLVQLSSPSVGDPQGSEHQADGRFAQYPDAKTMSSEKKASKEATRFSLRNGSK